MPTEPTEREEVIKALHARDAKMRIYFKSVDCGFDCGYPKEWDAELEALLSSERLRADERLRVVREAVEKLDRSGCPCDFHAKLLNEELTRIALFRPLEDGTDAPASVRVERFWHMWDAHQQALLQSHRQGIERALGKTQDEIRKLYEEMV